MNSLLSDLYTIEGRIGRLYFLGRLFLLGILGGGLFFTAVMGEPVLYSSVSEKIFHAVMMAYFLFMAVLILLPPFMLMTRRLHDIGMSGWLLILLLGISTSISILIAMTSGEALGLKAALVLNVSLVSLLCVFLIVWPGNEGKNKYGQGKSLYYTSSQPSKKEKILQKVSNPKVFKVILSSPIPEESLYIFEHLKTEYRDIQKINIPDNREKVEFIIAGHSKITTGKLHKIISGFGIQVRAVRKTVN